jgi:RNA polymerase sigma-70 factor, ECF subfamily
VLFRFDFSRPDYNARIVAIHAGVQCNDPEAEEDLFHLVDQVTRARFSRAFRADPDVVHDLTTDCYLKALLAIRNNQVREPVRLSGYIRAIANYMVAGEIEERIKRRKRVFDSIEVAGNIRSCPDEGPECGAQHAERRRVMYQALATLNTKERELLVRFYLEREPMEHLRADLGMTDTQFRLLKSRAKAKFGAAGKKLLLAKHRILSRSAAA